MIFDPGQSLKGLLILFQDLMILNHEKDEDSNESSDLMIAQCEVSHPFEMSHRTGHLSEKASFRTLEKIKFPSKNRFFRDLYTLTNFTSKFSE